MKHLFILFFLLQGTLAEGCTCINLDPDNALENDYNYNYAVYGDVVGIDTATDYYGNDYLSYKVKVVGIYKKSRGIRAGGVIEICSWIGSSACGVTLNKGERYILFYRKRVSNEDVYLFTDICKSNCIFNEDIHQQLLHFKKTYYAWWKFWHWFS